MTSALSTIPQFYYMTGWQGKWEEWLCQSFHYRIFSILERPLMAIANMLRRMYAEKITPEAYQMQKAAWENHFISCPSLEYSKYLLIDELIKSKISPPDPQKYKHIIFIYEQPADAIKLLLFDALDGYLSPRSNDDKYFQSDDGKKIRSCTFQDLRENNLFVVMRIDYVAKEKLKRDSKVRYINPSASATEIYMSRFDGKLEPGQGPDGKRPYFPKEWDALVLITKSYKTDWLVSSDLRTQLRNKIHPASS